MGLASPLRSFIALLGISAFLTSLSRAEDTQPAAAESVAAIEAQLEDRVRRDPADASAWRMLGRLRMQNSDLSGALNALRTSIDVDPLSAAAFADFAAVSREMGDEAEAAGALERVIELAPDSEYAAAARVSLAQMTASGVVPVSYEVRPLMVRTMPL
jgi:tetratricopeptide (TPR) repeat protein